MAIGRTRSQLFSILAIGLSCAKAVSYGSDESYYQTRQQLVNSDQKTALSAPLSDKEKQADAVLAGMKGKELLRDPFLPATHFFDAVDTIKDATLFHALEKMPKGAVLHTHVDSVVDLDWVIRTTTYDEDLYLCGQLTGWSKVQFKFMPVSAVATTDCDDSKGWQQVTALRKAHGDASAFDGLLMDELSMVTSRRPAYKDITMAWNKFQRCFGVVGGLIFYEKYHLAYVTETAKLFRDDGVSHLELRHVFQAGIGQVYKLDGSLHPVDYTLDNIQKAYDSVPGITARVIYCMVRNAEAKDVKVGLATAQAYMAKYPDLVVGFDLVGQEDPGYPLLEFINVFLEQPEPRTPTFFHAGETDWALGPADMNLFDAVLLNTSRIGHGYGLSRHQALRSAVTQKNIAIEVCPISNQVLFLVQDLRNHPMVQFTNEGMPVTISPDDPSLWGATGVSYDWFLFYLASGDTTGLSMLKQVVLNSISGSALTEAGKQQLTAQWTTEWDAWIDWLVKQA